MEKDGPGEQVCPDQSVAGRERGRLALIGSHARQKRRRDIIVPVKREISRDRRDKRLAAIQWLLLYILARLPDMTFSRSRKGLKVTLILPSHERIYTLCWVLPTVYYLKPPARQFCVSFHTFDWIHVRITQVELTWTWQTDPEIQ